MQERGLHNDAVPTSSYLASNVKVAIVIGELERIGNLIATNYFWVFIRLTSM
jgi:hypothetical protein